MAANSGGYTQITTIVTCEGDLSDPGFPIRWGRVLGKLNAILGEKVKVRKLEPWNSVRVTLSIPREAALRLRQLANEGSQQLRALGILSVQVEGDQVISLRLATGSVNSDPQEIILRTAQDGGNNGRTDGDVGLSRFLSSSSGDSSSSSTTSSITNQVQFKSPNVVCPPDTVVPKVPASSGTTATGGTTAGGSATGLGKVYGGPFPFTSMNQAIHSSTNSRETLPPPYPGKHPPPVTISSPLLVNLLQNDGGGGSGSATMTTAKESTKAPPVVQQSVTSARPIRTAPVPSATPSVSHSVPKLTAQSPIANVAVPAQGVSLSGTTTPSSHVLVNNTISPSSALSSNTSIRQNTILTSTTPPQYHRPVTLQTQQTPTTVLPVVQQQSVISLPNVASSGNNTSSVSIGGPLSQATVFTQQQPSISLNPSQSSVGLNQQQQPILSTALPQPVINRLQQTPALSAAQSNSTLTMPPLHNATLDNVLTRSLPSPPPYSVAISRPWDSLVHHSAPLLDLTPSLTDLKPDDLDAILPSLERDLAHSPLPDLADLSLPHNSLNSLTNCAASMSTQPAPVQVQQHPPPEDNRKFLINPLTGELEPQSSGESETEEVSDVFTGLPSPAALSDDDTSSTTRPDTNTDQSDSETRSSTENVKHSRLKNTKARDRGRDSPAQLKPTEKIKLRLKLEKSEPINPAYKVDVSFINTQPKKASASVIPPGEELRVPPLHISLRGRNSVVLKKKPKLNPDGTPVKPKIRKNQDHLKNKKGEGGVNITTDESIPTTVGDNPIVDQMKSNFESKKVKKFKSNHDHKEMIASLTQEGELKSKLVIHNHFKEKQKERRGSDSELVRTSKKYLDSNGIVCDEKKRRLSQSEHLNDEQPAILGSTNVGTIMGLPQKPRKDKVKIKDGFKNKDISRNKLFSKSLVEKLKNTQVTLPTAGEIDMEAKFKQRMLEETGEKGVPRPPHRTEVLHHLITENNRIEHDKITKTLAEPPPLKDKTPEPDKCNTPERKNSTTVVDLVENKSTVVSVVGGRSPTSGSAGQGEDSGIESMDALSEKSPNQASQSPHADLPLPLPPANKTQVPDMLDIEAQLAKMEGLNGDASGEPGTTCQPPPTEDVNENKHNHVQVTNITQCCELTSALQDSLKQGTVSLTTGPPTTPPPLPPEHRPETTLTIKLKKEEELEPRPVRVTPPLYTYSNPDKSRAGSESPTLSDEEDSNLCPTSGSLNSKNKSLLEQLLIEIPNDHQSPVPSSPSPATRSSVRTRALSKLGSPELNSPVTNKQSRAAPTIKRKRNESDSSNHSVEDTRNKKSRKCSENAAELIKVCMGVTEPTVKLNNIKKPTNSSAPVIPNKVQDESSDSDEPLIEKLRKTSSTTTTNNLTNSGSIGTANNVAKSKISKSGTTGGTAANNNKSVQPVTTRRSVRSNLPVHPNTRSKGDVKAEAEALRRKTRSAVSEVESKRKKEVK